MTAVNVAAASESEVVLVQTRVASFAFVVDGEIAARMALPVARSKPRAVVYSI